MRFEGSFSRATIAARAENFGRNPVHDVAAMMEAQRITFSEHRKRTFLSCWHMNDLESAAMWATYLSSGQGIAITTDFGTLLGCLKTYLGFVELGMVEYKDFSRDPVPMADLNGYFPYFYKRASFAHEREFRVVLWDGLGTFLNQDEVRHTLDGQGIKLPLILNDLVREVRIVPGAAGWLRDVVESSARLYGLASPVVQSELDGDPLY